MKTSLSVSGPTFCMAFLLVCSLSLAKGFSREPVTDPASKLTRVVLFTDRAMIQKEAQIVVRKGENLIRFAGLPASLVDGSIQAEIVSRQDMLISGVKVSETRLSDIEPVALTLLRKRSEGLRQQIATLEGQVETIRSSADFLRRVIPFGTAQRVSEAEMEAHAKYLERVLGENFGRIATLEQQQRQLLEEKQRVDAEMQALQQQNAQSKTLEISLQSPTDASGVVLNFWYVTHQAGWSPLYEARARYADSKVALNFLASIRQSTGEDWPEAQIEISTAQPFIYGSVPELRPWYIDLYTPRPVALRMATAEKSLMAVADANGAMQEEAFFGGATASEEATSFRFLLPRRVTIPSDGETHNISLASSEKEAEFTYYAIPKQVQTAFLKTKLQNPFDFPLMTGSVNLYLDGRLSGNAFIRETVVAGGDLELALGADETVKIERKLEKKDTGYAGLLSKSKSVTYTYHITLTNGKSKEVKLILEDQFPVSQNEKITVVQLAPKPSEAEIDEKGKVIWRVTLAPEAAKRIPLSFRVEYAQDLSVQGLE